MYHDRQFREVMQHCNGEDRNEQNDWKKLAQIGGCYYNVSNMSGARYMYSEWINMAQDRDNGFLKHGSKF